MANYKFVDTDQLEADLTAVANSIRTKGETTGALAFPAGFQEAVANISTGIDVQVKNGTLTTNTKGTATVNLGFKPDVVRLSVGHTWEDVSFETAADFHAGNADKIACADFYDDESIFVALYVIERTSTGFNIEASYRDYDFEEAVLKNKTITYSAVKFT